MITVVCKYIPYAAVAIFPFVLLQNASLRGNKLLLHHERIHLRQQVEMLFLPFYLLYLLHYLYNLIRFRNHDRAYRQVIFEREAYTMESDFNYLRSRRWCAWWRF